MGLSAAVPPELHRVHNRPPVLGVPPLVWIDGPGTPKALDLSAPLWEWPAPLPPRSWPPARRVAVAVVVSLGLVAADQPLRLSPVLIPGRTRLLPLPVVAVVARAARRRYIPGMNGLAYWMQRKYEVAAIPPRSLASRRMLNTTLLCTRSGSTCAVSCDGEMAGAD
jgi:hypothetical protein